VEIVPDDEGKKNASNSPPFGAFILTDIRDLVRRHRLFEREIAFYAQILPALKRFVRSRRGEDAAAMDVTFSVPK